MSIFTIGWITWFGFFAILEGIAMFRKEKGDTLSEHVWKWFAIKKEGKLTKTRRLALAAGLLWVAVNLMSGGGM